MRGCELPENFLSQKIDAVDKWVKSTLGQAKLVPTPFSFDVVKGIERPRDGDPFEILWVKFDFEDDMWHDEVMWDIRYLLMGSKMNKLPGFPSVLREVQQRIYISRDGISERARKLGSL